MSNKLIVILGPTASGKTALSIKLAKKFGGEIVSADSRQVYKGMDIGTGKISKKEMEGIPHHLLDVASPKRKFSVAQYQKLAIKAINKILKKGNIPFLVGGSPFYIYSVVEGWQFPKATTNLKLRKTLEKKTAQELFALLKRADPGRAKTIEQKNKRRLIRAIEISQQLSKIPKLKKNSLFDCLMLGIKVTKEDLKEKISKRVNKMLKLGLEKEVKGLIKKYGFNSVLSETIGYYEWADYFEKKKTPLTYLKGKLERLGLKEVTKQIKLHTMQFAKHQMTWFKRDKRIIWFEKQKQAEKLIKNFLSN